MFKNCRDHESSVGIEFPGIFIKMNFLTDEESEVLVNGVDDSLGWDASQSGRRKKNFGPKVNFKKKKLSVGAKFGGFPAVTKFVRERLRSVPLLSDFETIEECFLEYDAARGSHIEPHIDDCWIWRVKIHLEDEKFADLIILCRGERVVTVNCSGHSVLTLTKHAPLYPQQYNLDLIDEYKNQLLCPLEGFIDDNVVIRIPMPEKSVIILYGPPRYQFEHSVLREDILTRRVAIAYREFTLPYQKNNPRYSEAEEIYKLCRTTLKQ